MIPIGGADNPEFRTEDQSIAKLEDIAWQAYAEGRKAPFTQDAGPGYVDPGYQLSNEWVANKRRIDDAQRRLADSAGQSRVLVICGSARNDGTCPGEISKTFRLVEVARDTLEQTDIHADVLDLSLLTSKHGRNIYPLQGLRLHGDAAVPLTVELLPQPRASPDQRLDGRDLRTLDRRPCGDHCLAGVLVPWYQSPSPLNLMIRPPGVRRRPAIPIPMSTSGKKAGKAKALEMAGVGLPAAPGRARLWADRPWRRCGC